MPEETVDTGTVADATVTDSAPPAADEAVTTDATPSAPPAPSAPPTAEEIAEARRLEIVAANEAANKRGEEARAAEAAAKPKITLTVPDIQKRIANDASFCKEFAITDYLNKLGEDILNNDLTSRACTP